MVHTATHRTATVLLTLVTMVTLAVALDVALAGPAAAFITEPQASDHSDEAPTDHQDASVQTSQESGRGGGFIDDASQQAPAPSGDASPPTGGVDAGLGGTASSSGLGAPHAVAAMLLAVAVGGHVRYGRRAWSAQR